MLYYIQVYKIIRNVKCGFCENVKKCGLTEDNTWRSDTVNFQFSISIQNMFSLMAWYLAKPCPEIGTEI